MTTRAMAEVITSLVRLGSDVTGELAKVFSPTLSTNAAVGALLQIHLAGQRRPVELSEMIGLTRGGTTKVVDTLEEHGLVERFHDPDDSDGRSVHVRLTAQGERTAGEIIAVIGPILATFIDTAAATLAAAAD